MSLTRREMLRLAAVAPVAAVGGAQVQLRWPIESIAKSPARIVLEDGSTAGRTLQLTRDWAGRVCTSRLKNVGETPARVREVVLFEYEHGHPAGSALYGEGFQMLSQTGGTLAKPVDLGNYTDVYRHDPATS